MNLGAIGSHQVQVVTAQVKGVRTVVRGIQVPHRFVHCSCTMSVRKKSHDKFRNEITSSSKFLQIVLYLYLLHNIWLFHSRTRPSLVMYQYFTYRAQHCFIWKRFYCMVKPGAAFFGLLCTRISDILKSYFLHTCSHSDIFLHTCSHSDICTNALEEMKLGMGYFQRMETQAKTVLIRSCLNFSKKLGLNSVWHVWSPRGGRGGGGETYYWRDTAY
jgi:hypothetical protein